VGHVALLSTAFQIIGVVIYFAIAPRDFAPVVIEGKRHELEFSTCGILAVVAIVTTLLTSITAYILVDVQLSTMLHLAEAQKASLSRSAPLSRQPSAAGSLSSHDIKIGPTLPSRPPSQSRSYHPSQAMDSPIGSRHSSSNHTPLQSQHGSLDPLAPPPVRMGSFQLGGGDLDDMLDHPIAQATV
jgi:hypothetical protein